VRRLAQILAALGLLAVICGAVAAALFYALIIRDLPELYSLKDYRPKLITRVLDVEGNEVSTLARERRVVVPIEKIPEHTVQAFIAAEDAAFYRHEGLDYPGILRAALRNIRAGEVKQGGSTITQQVAKTFLLGSERKFRRKLKDMVLARRIEQYLKKNEILYLYLNQIYLGGGAYGVEAAAQTYFDKSVDGLTLAESALIAGLVPAPSRWNPFRSMSSARARQRRVLAWMLEQSFIRQEEYDAALSEELVFASRDGSEVFEVVASFTEEVRRYLVERYGEEEVLTGGMTVRTTLDFEAQQAAHRSVQRGLRDHDRRSGYRGPIRLAPEAEWLALAEDLESRNSAIEEKPGTHLDALVIEVDDRANQARLALGLTRETVLTLEDVKWAREADPEKDGAIVWVRRVREVLKPGYLVTLEHTGTRPPTEEETKADPLAPPVPEYALYQEPLAEGALFAMDVDTGRVEAMIGGYSFTRSQFNRAVQMRRQPGSAFKPIIYAAAMTRGFTPATIVFDTPIVYEDLNSGLTWKPENYSDKFYGPITLRESLAKSRNIATIKLLRSIGIPPVLETAQALGVRAELEPNLSLALGTSEVTLAELVRTYNTFPAGGRRIAPIFILEIRDRNGKVLERNVPLPIDETVDVASAEDDELAAPERGDPDINGLIAEIRSAVDRGDDPGALPAGYGLDPVDAYLMVDLLKAVVKEGTGWRLRALKRPIAGKTGTTNDLYDAWFIGFTPRLAAGVWVGYDSARNLGKNETGSRAASPIFVDFMREALEDHPREEFPIPDGIEFSRIDKKTGLRATPEDESAVFQAFREGTAPLEFAPSQASGSPHRRAVRLD